MMKCKSVFGLLLEIQVSAQHGLQEKACNAQHSRTKHWLSTNSRDNQRSTLSFSHFLPLACVLSRTRITRWLWVICSHSEHVCDRCLSEVTLRGVTWHR
ncbi:hypothetical protein MHYP_G00174840 [Metynnis hypsauchen]